MKQSKSQGKSKKQYVPPLLEAHGKVYQLTKGGYYPGGSEFIGYFSTPA